jgi:CheY-like chemotaxis protein
MNSIPILYVEDEEADVMLLQHVLGKVGIHNPLHTVKDGKLAKDYLAGKVPFNDRQRHPLPGLVLLDLNLPYWSGFEVLEWIRQQPELRRVPVVILSSSNRPDDIARAYDAGANGYLVKPKALAELISLLLALRDFWLLHNQFPDTLGAGAPGAACQAASMRWKTTEEPGAAKTQPKMADGK